MKLRAALTIIGAIIGFVFGGSIGIASGGGAVNGALPCSIIGALIGFLASADIQKIIGKLKR